MTEKEIEIDGAGRTDAGVHAKNQTASVHLAKKWDPKEILQYMNQYLPEDICVKSVEPVSERFHARLWAEECGDTENTRSRGRFVNGCTAVERGCENGKVAILFGRFENLPYLCIHKSERSGAAAPHRTIHRGIEQLAARRAHNPEVGGSSPPPATKADNLKGLSVFCFHEFLRDDPFSYCCCA